MAQLIYTKTYELNVKHINKTRGFSLVELLVVVAILAILAAIAIPLFLNQRSKAAQGAVQSDARNLATSLTTVFANLPRSVSAESLNVSLNNNTAVGATLSGPGTIAVGGETLNVNLSPDVTITKTGNANHADGTGLKITHAGVDNWACVIPLPFSVAYAQTSSLQQTCGTVVSETGNLVPMNMATGTDALQTTVGIGRYVANPPGGVYSSTDIAYAGLRSIRVQHQSTRTDALVTGFQTVPEGCCPVPGSITLPAGGGNKFTLTALTHLPVTPRTVELRMFFFDSSNTIVGEPYNWKSSTVSGWESNVLTGDIPANATKASFFVRVYIPTVGESFYADNVGFWVGEGGVWAPPGVPIVK